MKNILFVCTGNTCRSPMAQLMLDRMLSENGIQAMVESAGLSAMDGMPVSHDAQRQLEKRGISSAYKYSQPLSKTLVDRADLILAMTGNHKRAIEQKFPESRGKLYTLSEYAGVSGGVSDPYGLGEEAYSVCALQIEDLLKRIINKI